ncbi:hypothetical protein BASA81_017376 [Batrachochytrium salamandrivorans]|nr:hypothetical protein BASA81_017376 [Batrachochytrium salamandrivorans]
MLLFALGWYVLSLYRFEELSKLSPSSSSDILLTPDLTPGLTLRPTPGPTPVPSASSATNSPISQDFPWWGPPEPGKPVISSHGDFQWVFPNSTSNSTEYALNKFTENERKSCAAAGESALCCTVGGIAAWGGGVRDGCGFRLDFMAEWQPIPNRAVYSLVDMILAWKRLPTSQPSKRMKIVFLGDSVTAQMFVAAVCELARNAKVESITYDIAKPEFTAAAPRSVPVFQEAHIQLVDHPQFDVSMVFIRQYKLATNPLAVKTYLLDADLIQFGLGLHHANNYKEMASILDVLFYELQSTATRKPRTIVWMGSPKQHFRFVGAKGIATGMYEHRRGGNQHCGPTSRLPVNHKLARTINDFTFDYITNTLNISASWFQWNQTTRMTTFPTYMFIFYPMLN